MEKFAGQQPAFLSADGAAESVVHHQCRLRALARRPVEVAVHHGALVRDLHGGMTGMWAMASRKQATPRS
ncbi:hypothetical protein [Actinacidiphila oryziradicis]|uniref:hypothetical protein n=1 Tax=Actinacidiphila oryziradicis TaxID=2571141 RepID=UPI001B80BB95|nr:hypothetical protein [Actinacidiphila oryziradicis]